MVKIKKEIDLKPLQKGIKMHLDERWRDTTGESDGFDEQLYNSDICIGVEGFYWFGDTLEFDRLYYDEIKAKDRRYTKDREYWYILDMGTCYETTYVTPIKIRYILKPDNLIQYEVDPKWH